MKTKEDDSNKLLIDDVSGDEALSFWSRIAARHIHQPRIINLVIVLICTNLRLLAALYALNAIVILRYYYYYNIMHTCPK